MGRHHISFQSQRRNNKPFAKIMKSFIGLACLLAVANAIPVDIHGGHQSHSSYHGSPAHKECETHYKSIYKTVYEHKDIKECHDIPKKICEHLKEKVCHEDDHSHKEICQYESHEKCHEEHKEICEHHDVKIPHQEEIKVPKTVCHFSKHSSFSGHRTHSNIHSGHSGFRTSGHNSGHNIGHNIGHNSGHNSGHSSSGHITGSSHLGR